MLSQTTKRFRDELRHLPQDVQANAKKAYRLWLGDPYHASLQFKTVKELYSARIGLSWRVLGFRRENTIIWFWIGSHAEYDKILAQL